MRKTTKIYIREMAEEDLSSVIEIEEACFSVPWSEKSYRDMLRTEQAHFWVAESAEKAVIGFFGILVSMDEGDVLNVAVRRELQGQGIGSQLVRYMVEASTQLGCRKLFLEVREHNTPAIAVYEKTGFVQVGTRKKYYQKPEEDALLMCRENA